MTAKLFSLHQRILSDLNDSIENHFHQLHAEKCILEIACSKANGENFTSLPGIEWSAKPPRDR